MRVWQCFFERLETIVVSRLLDRSTIELCVGAHRLLAHSSSYLLEGPPRRLGLHRFLFGRSTDTVRELHVTT